MKEAGWRRELSAGRFGEPWVCAFCPAARSSPLRGQGQGHRAATLWPGKSVGSCRHPTQNLGDEKTVRLCRPARKDLRSSLPLLHKLVAARFCRVPGCCGVYPEGPAPARFCPNAHKLSKQGTAWLVGKLPQDPTFFQAPLALSGCPWPKWGRREGSSCLEPVLASGWIRVVRSRNIVSPAGHSAGSNKRTLPDQYFECTWGPAAKRNPLVSTFIN